MTEARNWQTIAGLRVVVGAFEGFVQGAPLYLTFWYKPQELATRGAIFLSMVSIAGSMNGLISYAIQISMDGRYGRPAWRWIFLIEGERPRPLTAQPSVILHPNADRTRAPFEGIVSIGFGILLVFILPNTPERVKRGFTAEEKKIALRRTQEAYNVPHTRPKMRQLVAALKDPKTWFYGNTPRPVFSPNLARWSCTRFSS